MFCIITRPILVDVPPPLTLTPQPPPHSKDTVNPPETLNPRSVGGTSPKAPKDPIIRYLGFGQESSVG